MNIKNLLLSGVLLSSIATTTLPQSKLESFTRDVKSFTVGGLTGVVTGALSAYTLSLIANTLSIKQNAVLVAFAGLYTWGLGGELQDDILNMLDSDDKPTKKIVRYTSWPIIWYLLAKRIV